jgi:hypothetical protein
MVLNQARGGGQETYGYGYGYGQTNQAEAEVSA